MSTAIVGIDIGSYSCYVSVAKKGGIETILNEYSDRCTLSCIHFSDKTRFIGTSANLQLITNPKNTINNFTPLLGKKFYDNNVQIELPYSHYRIVEEQRDLVAIEVSYLGSKVQSFTPERLVAMLVTKLRLLAEGDLRIPVREVVLNTPGFYTDVERRCLVNAVNIAGLGCRTLINDLTAVALHYHSMRAQSFTTPKIVAFVDCGYSNFQTAIVHFTKVRFEVLHVNYEPNLGGRNFDRAIYKYLSRHFAEKYSVDVHDSTKAGLRLMAECEKIKKRLSANSAEFTVNIECLMNDKDVSAKIDRALFEKLCQNLINRMKTVIQMMLQQFEKNAKVPISSVEIVGGTSRIPCVKQMITECFKMEPQNTLNADEAVSRGCAIQCAMMNENCMIRQIEFQDVVSFGITLDTFDQLRLEDLMKYDADQKFSAKRKSVPIVENDQKYPFKHSVELSFDDGSIIEIRYTDRNEVPNDNKTIVYIKINHEASPAEKMCNILLEYSIDKFGIFKVNNLALIRNSKSPRSTNVNTLKSEQAPPVNTNKNDLGKKKAKTDKPSPVTYDIYGPIDFQVIDMISWNSKLEEYLQKEKEFIEKDFEETERLNVKNQLEESIYKCRDLLTNLGPSSISKNDYDYFLKVITDTETWLFDEGDNEDKNHYEERLKQLDMITKHITKKPDMNQNESHPSEELECTLKNAEHVLNTAMNRYPTSHDEYGQDIENLKNVIERSKGILQLNGNSSENDNVVKSHISELKRLIDSVLNRSNNNNA